MTETPSDASTAVGTTGSRRLLLVVVSAAIFLDALDLSITQIALPTIQASLQVSTSALPWVGAAYVVTYGGFMLLGGRAGDLLGNGRVFVAGLAIFGAASLACGLAGSGAVLIAARAVQGVGAALTVPTAVAMLAGTFTEERSRARAFGIFSAAAATGFTAGLVFGGLITSGLSWRWIFLLKVPAVALTLVAAMFGLRELPQQRARGSYDFAGAVTATAGATLLTYGITRAGAPGADPLLDVAAPLAGSAAFLGLFVIIERHAATPLLPLRLVRRRTTAVANAAALTVLAAPFAISYLVTLYMQGVLHHPPWQVAVALLPGSIASALVSRYLAPFLLHRYGLRRVYSVALGFVAVGAGILIGLTEATATWLIVLAALISFGLGMGLAYPAATFGGVHGVDAGDQGAAGGLNNTALQIGGGIGLAIVASVITIGLGGSPPDQVAAHVGLQAARWGAVAAAALPLLGALVVAIGLRDRNGADDRTDDRTSDRGRPAS